ncbi:hypothetical protein HJC23_006472 [Cyclotella cryptica]|uniref:glucose-6-phosphate 1-epimerase n=1 Tax=Cyclotella cryptica TaxID=29204 RepID=A0ABD3QWJ0_9STRA|eukprot:CCRYP_001909-RA/>CCRYP_001909-RA protein AED:0.07 eAED:0.07 QI:175/1/1/1/1/1/3/66/299
MSKDPITITHSASGATFTINPFGAHITSWTVSDGRSLIFISRDAIMDGSKAIRGGIPLCFPQFGQPDKSYPQHGFLRNNYWTTVNGSKFDDEEAAGISMELALKDAIHARGGKWDLGTTLDCKCIFSVKIDGKTMTNTLTVENTGNEAFDFQVLLHMYYLVTDGKALDGALCNVNGLEGYSVSDKVSGEEYILGSEPVTIPDGIIDRVYTAPDGKIDLDVTVSAGRNIVSLKANGHVDGEQVPVSCVVWNPHAENAKKMGDFGDDQYIDMICVEPGMLSNVPMLKGGKKTSFTQVMTCL